MYNRSCGCRPRAGPGAEQPYATATLHTSMRPFALSDSQTYPSGQPPHPPQLLQPKPSIFTSTAVVKPASSVSVPTAPRVVVPVAVAVAGPTAEVDEAAALAEFSDVINNFAQDEDEDDIKAVRPLKPVVHPCELDHADYRCRHMCQCRPRLRLLHSHSLRVGTPRYQPLPCRPPRTPQRQTCGLNS